MRPSKNMFVCEKTHGGNGDYSGGRKIFFGTSKQKHFLKKSIFLKTKAFS
jgi:hypothetical protein